MKRDPGDILDRFSIATLKKERIALASSHEEFELFKKGYIELLATHEGDAEFIKGKFEQLLEVNGQIWDLENELRQGHIDNEIMKIGERAISIRKINARRIGLCNEVNQHFNEGVENVKKYHISE